MKKGILLTIALATMALFTNAQDNIIPGGGFDDATLGANWATSGTTATTASVSLSGGGTLTPHNGARFLVSQNTATAPGIAQVSFATTMRPTSIEGAFACFPASTDQYLVVIRLSKWDQDSNKRDTIALGTFQGGATGTKWAYRQLDLSTIYQNAETPDSCLIIIYAGVHAGTNGGLAFFQNSALGVDALKMNNHAVSVPIVFDEAEKMYNYPNPVSGKTTISYGLKTASTVDITVTDMTGKQVATIFSGEQAAGRQEVVFDATALKPGVYFYTVKAGNAIETKKFVVTR